MSTEEKLIEAIESAQVTLHHVLELLGDREPEIMKFLADEHVKISQAKHDWYKSNE